MSENLKDEFYQKWVDSTEYSEQSSLENGIYDKYSKEIKSIVGESEYHQITDYITSLACEAEQTSFEIGLEYGIKLMTDILKAGDIHA